MNVAQQKVPSQTLRNAVKRGDDEIDIVQRAYRLVGSALPDMQFGGESTSQRLTRSVVTTKLAECPFRSVKIAACEKTAEDHASSRLP